jgi:hypothetical protein
MSTVTDRGTQIYNQRLRSTLETPDNQGRLVAVEVVSGDYELADGPDYLPALLRLRGRHEDAQVYILRIGYPAAFSRGIRWKPQ